MCVEILFLVFCPETNLVWENFALINDDILSLPLSHFFEKIIKDTFQHVDSFIVCDMGNQDVIRPVMKENTDWLGPLP